MAVVNVNYDVSHSKELLKRKRNILQLLLASAPYAQILTTLPLIKLSNELYELIAFKRTWFH